jgi:hypothetical protein
MSGSPVPALSEGLSPGLSSGRVNGGSAWLTGDPEALDRRAARSDLLRFDCFDIHICEAGRSGELIPGCSVTGVRALEAASRKRWIFGHRPVLSACASIVSM